MTRKPFIFCRSISTLAAALVFSLTVAHCQALASSKESVVAEACMAFGQQCGNAQTGPSCCSSENYCQPWNPSYYQCRAKPTQCGTPEVDVDYDGDDLESFTGMTLPDECCNKCSATSGCAAFTFINYGWDGKTHCYLKKGTGTKKSSSGAISAVVTNFTANNGDACGNSNGVSGTVNSPLNATDLASTTTTLTTTSTSTTASTSGHIQAQIRSGAVQSKSANLGGWLVSEYWMSYNSCIWNDVSTDIANQGEYIVMKTLASSIGKTAATALFEQHRQTWITEADIKEIAATGVLNTVRVPVGHWIIRDATTTPGTEADMYAPGGLKYLDTLINDWAVKYNLAVVLSLHAHQGSQNGFDNGSPSTFAQPTWSTSQTNIDNSIKFATFLATRYQDSPAFLGMNLMNEPKSPTDMSVVKSYYVEAYKQIRATGNKCILLLSPLVTEPTPSGFTGMISGPQYENVWYEIHPYFIWGFEDTSADWILSYLDTYKTGNLEKYSNNNRLYVGEVVNVWS